MRCLHALTLGRHDKRGGMLGRYKILPNSNNRHDPYINTILYKFGNKFGLLPNLYYLCTRNQVNMNACKKQILEIAQTNHRVNANFLATACGMKPVTARQYLSELAKEKKLVRIGQGVYAIAQKQAFTYKPSESVKEIYLKMKTELPFTDFCVYDGNILSSIQHHLSINHAIYVETNRDAVESVFIRLKELYKNVYRQPSSAFMYDYIDLREECIIVKTLVTESPLMEVDGIKVPTLEKLLVDTQKDADFDYLRGSESANMFQLAFDQYTINPQRLIRYAKRRSISQEIQELINQTK